jgi:ParB family chromosome partitioning protein
MLGKGLESLIPPRKEGEGSEERSYTLSKRDVGVEKRLKMENAIFHIEIDRIRPNPNQPRKQFNERALQELAASIREFGVLQPLIVSKTEEETDSGTSVEYELIAGERRLRASKIAGLRMVPAIIRRMPKAREKLELAILENIQRADLSPIEMARAFSQLQDEFNFTQREIASRLGKSREVVANALRLLNLPSEIQDAIGEGVLGESHARLLLSVSDIGRQRALFAEITKDGLSVRELKARIDASEAAAPGKKKKKRGSAPISPEALAFKEKMEEFLGTRVDVVRSGDKGKITINFYSPEEFNALIEKFSKNLSE